MKPLSDEGIKRIKFWPFAIFGIFIIILVVFLGGIYSKWTEQASNTQRNPSVLKSQWQKLYKDGKLNQAAKKMRQYLILTPKDWKSRKLLADVYLRLGENQKAFTQLLQANSGNRLKADQLYNLGLLADQLGRYENAAKYLSKAVNANPSDTLYRTELAKALTKIKRHDQAIAQWSEIINLLPDKDLYAAIIYAQLGDAYFQKGEAEKAKEAYRLGLEIEPGNVYLQAQSSQAGSPRDELEQ